MDHSVNETELLSQIDQLIQVSARSQDPFLAALVIALSCEKVRRLFLDKYHTPIYNFNGVKCLTTVSIPEQKRVLFQFDCKPGVLCLLNPSFMVIVDMISGGVISVIDPFIQITVVAD
jgi:hypothetical protein